MRVMLSRWVEEQEAPGLAAETARAERQTRAIEQQAKFARWALFISLAAVTLAGVSFAFDVFGKPSPPTAAPTNATKSDDAP